MKANNGWLLIFNLEFFLTDKLRDHISASQPEPRRLDSGIGSGDLESVEDDERTLNGLCFSQPVHLDHMLLSTQMQCTPGASQVKENQHQFSPNYISD